ncbi:MAG TPA: galactokinase [Flavobacterium sp.]|jgi:galactokinase
MKEKLASEATAFFEQSFGKLPEHIFLSPGRINIIGEHVDYNDGYVLPAAVDKYVCLAMSAVAEPNCVIIAKDIDERYEFSIEDTLKPVEQMWVNYFLGVLSQIKERQMPITGFKIAFTSTVPIGAGMSSSAAVECAFGHALNEIFNLGLEKKEIALIGQKAEHTFVGVMCGIMDQFASVFGKENHVIKLDCNTLEYEYHNADFKEYSLLLLNSNVTHELLKSGYNDRRQEVEKGLLIIKDHFPEVTSFRDCSEQQVDQLKDELGDPVYKRCHFVVKEIKRVLEAVDALERADYAELGRLMFETHDGLSKEYEVSCDETDFLVEVVRADELVLGARMMGGGFGGCTINLVKKGHEDELIERVSAEYFQKFGVRLTPYKVNIADGTSTYKP